MFYFDDYFNLQVIEYCLVQLVDEYLFVFMVEYGYLVDDVYNEVVEEFQFDENELFIVFEEQWGINSFWVVMEVEVN